MAELVFRPVLQLRITRKNIKKKIFLKALMSVVKL